MTGEETRAGTADPLGRTVLAWQRTLLGIAAVALVVVFALSRNGMGVLVVAVLALAMLPVPLAVRRERELLAECPAEVRLAVLYLMTAAAVGIATIALVFVVLLS